MSKRLQQFKEVSKPAPFSAVQMTASWNSIGSLFSGAGGLDLGFLLTGRFRVEFAAEVLDSPTRSFSKNFGLPLRSLDSKSDFSLPVAIKGRVEDLDSHLLRKISLDILTGGPPCQDFSIVRGPEWDRRGIEVKRGQLYLHFIRLLTALKPNIFVFENVPGLLNSNRGAAYQAILKDFENAGWEKLFADVIDSAHFGVPQHRRRLVIAGIRRDLLNGADLDHMRQVFMQSLKNSSSLLTKYPLTPLEAFEGQPLPNLKEKYREIMGGYEDLLSFGGRDVVDDYLKVNNIFPANAREMETVFEQHGKILHMLGWLGRRASDLQLEDGSTDLPQEAFNVSERMKQIPPDKNCEVVRGTKWEVEGRGISLIYRRLHPLKPAYTVVAYGGGGTWGYHYERSRSKMTHRERARLQSFPDWFTFQGNSREIRAQIGEAVPPLLAKRIAEACLNVLGNI